MPAPWWSALFQLDGAFDFDRQTDAVDGQRRLCGQCFVALELAAADGAAHRLLDLALRRDADLFQKFAHADVQGLFVHDRLLKVPERWPCAILAERQRRNEPVSRAQRRTKWCTASGKRACLA